MFGDKTFCGFITNNERFNGEKEIVSCKQKSKGTAHLESVPFHSQYTGSVQKSPLQVGTVWTMVSWQDYTVIYWIGELSVWR